MKSVTDLEQVIAEMEAITELEKKQRNCSSMSGSGQENGEPSPGGGNGKTDNIWVKRLATDDSHIWLKREKKLTKSVKFSEGKLRSASRSYKEKQSPAKVILKNQRSLSTEAPPKSPSHFLNKNGDMSDLVKYPCGSQTSNHLDSEFYGTNRSLSEISRTSSDNARTVSVRSTSSSNDELQMKQRISTEHSSERNLELSDFCVSNGSPYFLIFLNVSLKFFTHLYFISNCAFLMKTMLQRAAVDDNGFSFAETFTASVFHSINN